MILFLFEIFGLLVTLTCVSAASMKERKKEMAKQAYSFCFISEAYLQKKKQESFAWKLKKERHFNE
jgi:organic hydroperoxide reductase OsmC/OhrA